MKGNVRIFAYDVNSKIQNSPKVSLEQQFGASGGFVLRMTIFRIIEVQFFGLSVVLKSPACAKLQNVMVKFEKNKNIEK